MSTYQYKAYDTNGKSVTGEIEADSEKQAKLLIKEKSLLLREIKEVKSTKLRYTKGISTSDLALFTRRLAILVASSIPLFDAISSLAEQETNKSFQKVLEEIKTKMSEGASLSKALATQPKIFNDTYVSMVTSGEVGGALDVILENLADFLEEQEQIKNKVLSALVYPAVMSLVGVAVMVFLFTFLIPKITTIFADNKAVLPFMTIVLIAISNLLRNFWWLIVSVIFALYFLYKKAMLQKKYLYLRDELILKVPVLGNVARDLIFSRFSRTMGILLASGVPIIRSLEITSESLINRVYKESIADIVNDVAQGAPLSEPLKRKKIYPNMLIHLISVGEKGGNMDIMLNRSAVAYEREFNAKLTRLMSLLEPMLVLAMGLAVGFVVLAVLIPIFDMNKLIK